MTIKSKIRYGWAYITGQRVVEVTDKVTETKQTYEADELSPDMQEQVLLYGIGKVLQDRNSQVAADAKMDGFDKVWQQLIDGTWKAARSGGGLGIVPAYIEVTAAKRGWKGSSGIAKAQKAWKATSEDTRAELLTLWAEDIQAVKDARASEDEVESLDDMLS
jgi:hypothetical protein